MRRSRALRRVAGVATPVVATPETPETITGLKAWFDARSDSYLTIPTGSEVSEWRPRAGSLSSALVKFTQGTSANRPTRVTALATFNNKNAIRFDGVNDQLVSADANSWKFLHDGTGGSVFIVRRIDSTGGANQFVLASSANVATNVGITYFYTSTPGIQLRIHDGDGVAANTQVTSSVATRDVSAWEMWGYVAGTSTYARSGGVATQADAGSPAAASNPTFALALSGSNGVPASSPYKGDIVHAIFYDHVLTVGERATLAAWAASDTAVAA